MIEIYVNNEKLDLADEDISFHFSQMLFSGKLIDDYSIDFEIPRTTRNERILNPTGALYRGQLFGVGIKCQIVTNGHTFNGILQVVEIMAKTLSVVVFSDVLPEHIAKAKLSELIHDDNTTIFDFPSAPQMAVITPAQPTTDAGLFPFEMAQNEPQYLLPSYYLPSIRLNRVLKMLSEATKILFPAVDSKYYLTATNRIYSPYDMHQYIWLHTKVQGSTRTHYHKNGGSAFCSSELMETQDGNGYIITFNRGVNVTIEMEAYGAWSGVPTEHRGSIARVAILNDDGSESDIADCKTTAVALHRTLTIDRAYKKGQRVKLYSVKTAVEGGVPTAKDGDASFFITYNFVDRNESEYNTELMPTNYDSTPADTPYFAKHYFNRVGAICNLADITIKDFLTAIAWQLGKQLRFENNVISFVDASETKAIKARIERMKPVSDALGKTTSLSDAEGREIVSVAVDNAFLAEDKSLYKSTFYYPQKSVGKPYVSIPIYTRDEGEYYKLSKIKGIPLSYVARVGASYYLGEPIPFVDGQNMIRQFSKVLEIEATTFDDISEARYVTIDGVKFAVIEGDRDANTGETTFRALQVTN